MEEQVSKYEIEITGDGYTNLTQSISIDDYSKSVIINNSDGFVNADDQSLIHAALRSKKTEDINKFDLNGDGKIDITDLSYVNKNLNAVGQPVIKDTTYIAKVKIA